MRRIIKEKDDIKVSIFSGGRLVRVFIDSVVITYIILRW